jgi:transglutaminase-like putative cysteine protease
MHIQYGYNIEIYCDQQIPLITMLDVHPSVRRDITSPDTMTLTSASSGELLESTEIYEDAFKNSCRRLIIPPGGAVLSAMGVMHHSGFEEDVAAGRLASPPELLPANVIPMLLSSRYCEVDKLSMRAWNMFSHVPNGYERVQAVCDYVHNIIQFDYKRADATRSASQVIEEGVGVCRDFAHLAITLCRALNVPARYCTGYLGDIGVESDPNPMDFSAWFEAYLEGEWWTFDARHNTPRIGRILIARGRDANDVPFIHSFGPHVLRKFEVITKEISGSRYPVSAQERRGHHQRRSLSSQQ